MPMTKREAEQALRSVGARKWRQGANHEIWMLPDGTKISLPRHPGDLSTGVEHQIKKITGKKK